MKDKDHMLAEGYLIEYHQSGAPEGDYYRYSVDPTESAQKSSPKTLVYYNVLIDCSKEDVEHMQSGSLSFGDFDRWNDGTDLTEVERFQALDRVRAFSSVKHISAPYFPPEDYSKGTEERINLWKDEKKTFELKMQQFRKYAALHDAEIISNMGGSTYIKFKHSKTT